MILILLSKQEMYALVRHSSVSTNEPSCGLQLNSGLQLNLYPLLCPHCMPKLQNLSILCQQLWLHFPPMLFAMAAGAKLLSQYQVSSSDAEAVPLPVLAELLPQLCCFPLCCCCCQLCCFCHVAAAAALPLCFCCRTAVAPTGSRRSVCWCQQTWLTQPRRSTVLSAVQDNLRIAWSFTTCRNAGMLTIAAAARSSALHASRPSAVYQERAAAGFAPIVSSAAPPGRVAAANSGMRGW